MSDTDSADNSTPIPAAIARLQKLVGGPRDNALLHHAIGSEWLKAEMPQAAAAAFREALNRDANHSAAWKLLGKALAECRDPDGARDAWRQGIAVAEARGDAQAVKEMRVFLKRLDRDPAG